MKGRGVFFEEKMPVHDMLSQKARDLVGKIVMGSVNVDLRAKEHGANSLNVLTILSSSFSIEV